MKTALILALLCLATPVAQAADPAARVLAEINLARTEPQRYAKIIAARIPELSSGSHQRAAREAVRCLEKMSPLRPLIFSPGLKAAAAEQVASASVRGLRGHRGADGSSPWERMDRHGRRCGTAAENIAYTRSDPRNIVTVLLIDAGAFSRGHRKNLLNPAFRHVGIATGPHARYGSLCVIDLAACFIEQPAPPLLGVR